MKRWLLLALLVCAAMLLVPRGWVVYAQSTSTPTATATSTSTATATATGTATGTPAIVVTGVTSNNQGFEVKRYINAGDIAIFMGLLILLGLVAWVVLGSLMQDSG